jgi:hypothetical protein
LKRETSWNLRFLIHLKLFLSTLFATTIDNNFLIQPLVKFEVKYVVELPILVLYIFRSFGCVLLLIYVILIYYPITNFALELFI